MEKIVRMILYQYNKLSKPIKASLWFTISYIIQRGLQFIGTPIYTRLMSATDYGVYSVFLSWFNLLCVFSSLNIYSGTFNKAMVKYETDRDRYISSVQCLTLLISGIVSVIILLFNKEITKFMGYSFKLQILLCVHLMLFPPLQYWLQKQRFLFEYRKLFLITLVNSGANLILGILFVLISNDKSLALISVTVGVQAAINMILFFSLLFKGRTFYKKEYWKWSFYNALPLVPHYLAEILLGHADRLMINEMCGNIQAGIYNVVYQISMMMTIIRSGINGAFTPWLFYSLKEKKYNEIRSITTVIMTLMWILTFFLMLIGPEILKIAAPASYYEAVVDIPAIMIGCFFIFVYVLFLNVEIYFEQNQYITISSIIAASLNVVLNYIYIQKFGYLVAGYTTMISYMFMAFIHYCFLKKIINKNLDLKLIIDIKYILIYSISILILGIFALYLYKTIVLRWCIIAIITLACILKRKTIIESLYKIIYKI